MLKKYRIDIFIILLLICIPIFSWVSMMPLMDRFMNTTKTLTSLGQLSSLVGMTMIALSMFFQLRVRTLSKLMAKPTTVTNVHHNLGVFAVVLLLLHPVFLSYRYLPISVQAAFDVIFKPTFADLIGLIALIFMTIGMLVSLFSPSSFRHWKGFHWLFIGAYLFSFYHLVFVVSDTSTNPLLFWYLITLMAAGGLSFGIQKTLYLARKYLV